MVDRLLPKQDVTGSNPVARSQVKKNLDISGSPPFVECTGQGYLIYRPLKSFYKTVPLPNTAKTPMLNPLVHDFHLITLNR